MQRQPRIAWKWWRNFHSFVQRQDSHLHYIPRSDATTSNHSIRHEFARIASRVSLYFLHVTYSTYHMLIRRDRETVYRREASLYTFTRIYIYTHTHIYIYIYTWNSRVGANTCVNAYIDTSTSHTYTHTHVHTYIYIYRYLYIVHTLPRGIPTALWSSDYQIHKRRFLYDAFKYIYLYYIKRIINSF